MVGSFVRPWAGEKLVGEVFAVSGDLLLCRAPGGAEFLVHAQDVRDGKCKVYRSLADACGCQCPRCERKRATEHDQLTAVAN